MLLLVTYYFLWSLGDDFFKTWDLVLQIDFLMTLCLATWAFDQWFICTNVWIFVDQICCSVYVSTILSCVIPQVMNFFNLGVTSID